MAKAAKKHGKAVICISGSLGPGVGEVYANGIDVVSGIAPGPLSLEECMEKGADLLADATERVCRALRTGRALTSPEASARYGAGRAGP